MIQLHKGHYLVSKNEIMEEYLMIWGNVSVVIEIRRKSTKWYVLKF